LIFLERLEIEAFRGFARYQDVYLDSDAVVVTGANGLGKTSLTDAVTWVLTDTLPQMPERQARRGEEYVVNRYRDGSEADVTLHVREGTASVALRRRGSSRNGTTLSLRTGDEHLVGEAASARLRTLFGAESQRELDMAVNGWGVLRQDAMRAVLTAPAEEFQGRLRDILGLGILADFEKAAKEAQKRASDEASTARGEAEHARKVADNARQEMEDARRRVEAASASELTTGGMQSRLGELSDLVELDESVLAAPDRVRDAAQLAGRLESDLRSMSVQMKQLLEGMRAGDVEADQRRLAADDVSVAALRGELDAAREALRTSERVHQAMQDKADDLARLASAALPLIDATCPVCSQEIDDLPSVRARLSQIVEERAGANELVVAAQDISTHRTSIAAIESNLATAHDASVLIRERIQRQSDSANQLAILQQQVRKSATEPPIDLKLLHSETMNPDGLEATAQALQELHRVLSAFVRTLRDRATAERMPRLEQRVHEANEQQSAVVKKLEALSRRESDAKGLADAATAASLDVTEEALAALDPYFGEVFGRLAAHPTFSQLGLEHDVYYGKARTWARISDPVSGVDANPQLVFSEGQLNVVALSYFLAFAMTAGSTALPFVILDDPLQSLDDMNVLGFADLCRHLRDGRQVIVTTHDRRFGNLLERKLRPRRPVQSAAQIHFDSWDREGPNFSAKRLTADEGRVLLYGASASDEASPNWPNSPSS